MRLRSIALATATAIVLGACGTPDSEQSSQPPATSEDLTESTSLTVVTHDSFTLPEELLAQFEERSGLEVTYVQPGDGGALVNQLILTRDSPLGDVVYGIDNSYATRAIHQGVISPYESPALPEESNHFVVEGLVPIDFGDVCINADVQYFEDNDLPVPTNLDYLIDPDYADMLVVPNPAASSPGLSFMLATIGAVGEEEWLDYWAQLRDNGLLVVSGWSEAYYGEFSGAGEGGERPLVVSYATSPAFTLTEDGDQTTTVALLGTCFRQVEYAGVIEGAQNETGAREFIDFLLSDDVQAALPESMFMYPVVQDTELPPDWVQFAPLSDNPIYMEPELISEHRDRWVQEWTDVVLD